MSDFVAYYRVSTKHQGGTGLGIEAQRKAVTDFINGNGSRVMAEHVEVESGKNGNRPELANALSKCKETGATLVVARLDRLPRNTKFLLTLVDAEVSVVFCDLPQIPEGPIGRFFITMLAATAELASSPDPSPRAGFWPNC